MIQNYRNQQGTAGESAACFLIPSTRIDGGRRFGFEGGGIMI